MCSVRISTHLFGISCSVGSRSSGVSSSFPAPEGPSWSPEPRETDPGRTAGQDGPREGSVGQLWPDTWPGGGAREAACSDGGGLLRRQGGSQRSPPGFQDGFSGARGPFWEASCPPRSPPPLCAPPGKGAGDRGQCHRECRGDHPPDGALQTQARARGGKNGTSSAPCAAPRHVTQHCDF